MQERQVINGAALSVCEMMCFDVEFRKKREKMLGGNRFLDSFYYICSVKYIFFEKMLGYKPLPSIFFEKTYIFAKHFLSYIQEKDSI